MKNILEETHNMNAEKKVLERRDMNMSEADYNHAEGMSWVERLCLSSLHVNGYYKWIMKTARVHILVWSIDGLQALAGLLCACKRS